MPKRRMPEEKMIPERENDPYRNRAKLQDPTVCPDCGATWRDGRWSWANGPADAPRVVCPACQRTRDRYPAGILTLRGDFLAQHRDEILALARNVEEREKNEHPMNRIMAVEEDGGATVVTTTDMHLARAIGSAVHAAYKGEIDYTYADDPQMLRVTWER
ncbi:MAG: ATPase [Proteobacteria bacterium]|nr:MAG: ATPase [Pseudomonadota bacterium]